MGSCVSGLKGGNASNVDTTADSPLTRNGPQAKSTIGSPTSTSTGQTGQAQRNELEQNPEAIASLAAQLKGRPVAASDPHFNLLVCRYESGRIIKQERPISDEFIAISHVWGIADWRHVECVGEAIMVSEEKAAFMENDFADLVGDSWFWMDILCVDQQNADARVAVTQHIPSIFRAAKKTIVIRESTGFRACCAEAAGLSSEFMGKTRYGRTPNDQDSDIDFADDEDGRQKLMRHMRTEHVDDPIDDGVLSRLWPLQEIILSNHVHFVQCKAVITTAGTQSSEGRTGLPPRGHDLVNNLSTLAVAWDTFGSSDESNMWHRLGTGKWRFFDAFFHLGEAKRTPEIRAIPEVPRARDIALHLTSTRHTSKPRDFILAVMPQYAFYTVPKNARKMTFCELFVDCCQQLRGHDVGVGPLLVESSNPLDGRIGQLSTGVPEPMCLGDLAKLFNGPVQRSPERTVVQLMTLQHQPFKTQIAKAQALDLLRGLEDVGRDEIDLAYAVSMTHLIVICIFASKTLWLASQPELVHEMDRLEPESDQTRVIQAFLRILGGIDWSEGSRVNAERTTENQEVLARLMDVPWETSALMAAMVSCGVPLSAYAWAEEQLDVLHLNVMQRSFVALASKSVVKPDTVFFMRQVDDYEMGRDGLMPRLSLLATNTDSENVMTQCIFPPDIALSDG